ncbi:MAG TPA: DUF4401 domain-containing protein [Acidiferrobacterales bacterium]|nr:DUF4401 domain-containing protein [Acidiferrobacterales bacterium]
MVDGEAPGGAVATTPWYVRTMLGIAGLIGALFLLGFVGAGFSFVMKSAAAALFVGALLCAAATILYRVRPKGDFINQFGFAVSLAGQALVCFGLTQLLSPRIAVVALLIALLEVALFLLIPNFLHRVWSAIAAVSALVIALNIWGFYVFTQAMVLAALSWAWLNEFRFPGRGAQIRALGYGLTLYAINTLVTMGWGMLGYAWLYRDRTSAFGGAIPWIGPALIGAITIWVVWKLLKRQGIAFTEGPGRAALGGAVLVALISIKAPGIGVTVVILLLGYANGNRVLTGLGILSLLAYWSYYYYLLHITLLQKSALLFCAGVALVAARLAMQRRWPIGEGAVKHHA